jgi:hypothetical protein
MGDRMFSFPSYTGVNSTYRLEFRVPLLRCNTTTTREERILEVGDFGVYIPGFVSTWYNDPTELSFQKHFVDSIYQMSTTENSTCTAIIDVQDLVYKGQSALFTLNVTHTEGAQSITHSISNVKAARYGGNRVSTGVKWPPKPRTATSDWGESIRKFTLFVAGLVPSMNEQALLDSLGSRMEMETTQLCFHERFTDLACTRNHTLDNGTAVVLCNWPCRATNNSQ